MQLVKYKVRKAVLLQDLQLFKLESMQSRLK